jgi:hypothetical protein
MPFRHEVTRPVLDKRIHTYKYHKPCNRGATSVGKRAMTGPTPTRPRDDPPGSALKLAKARAPET